MRTARPRHLKAVAVVTLASLAFACSSSDSAPPPLTAPGDTGDNTPAVAVNDTPDPTDAAPTPDAGGWPAGTKLRTTADLNLRDQPSTAGTILKVIPAGSVVTVLDPVPQNVVWWNIDSDGVHGWASGKYLEIVPADGSTGPADLNGTPSPSNAIARAKLSVGFSYWWGGGAWTGTAVTPATAGQCVGSGCPSCTHNGKYGADCSGMVAKAWQFGVVDLTVDSHPYSTASFVVPKAGYWADVSRGSLAAGDALVYNSGGSGHIALYESGDGWGTPTVYECKGCSYGCVHDTRSFSSTYKGIRRATF